MSTIEPGIYVHYKSEHKRYEVLGVAQNTETSEEYVIYKPLYKESEFPEFWVRPYEMFTENVIFEGKTIPRFHKVDN